MFKESDLFNKMGDSVNKIVNESGLPNKNFESTVGVYGGKLKVNKNNRMVFDNTGVISKIDKFGDAVLRTYDEHMMKNPAEVLKNHPNWFFKFLAPGTKRYRGTTEEIAENAKALGLDEYYDISPDNDGVEIKNQEIYTEGVALQDIFRSDLIHSQELEEIDRFEALKEASLYLNEIHEKAGQGIGEVLSSDIIYREKNNKEVSKPVLNIPDIIYSKEKETSEIDQKSTDMLDFLLSVGIEELRRSEDFESVNKAIKTIVSNYDNEKVLKMVKSYVKRGRIVFAGNKDLKNLSKSSLKATSLHNQARFGIKDADVMTTIKEIITKNIN
ncbi:MAG: hypothetical protein ACLFNO_01770 [Parcubacteria group bacterium]